MKAEIPVESRSLKSRVIGASAWVAGGHLLSQVLRLVSNLILTRLLVPEMFGVMVVAQVIVMGISMFSDVGLQQNVVQSERGDDPDFLNTVWLIQIARGVVIWVLVLGLMLLLNFANDNVWFDANSVYASPGLSAVLAVLSLTALIGGFVSMKMATAKRNLQMNKVVQVELLSQVGSLIIMIVWAILHRSVWALVAGSVSVVVFKVILSHLYLSGIRTKLHWDREIFWDVFHFGKWIFLTSIMGFLALNGDRLLLGGMISAAEMGQFGIALFMANAVSLMAKKIISSVAFSALSEVIRKRPADLKKVYYQLRLPVDVILLFATGFLVSSGHLLIEVLYDDRYSDAGWMLEILSINLVQVRYSLAGQCYVAMGKPGIELPIALVKVACLFVLLPLAFNYWGLVGAVWVAGGVGIVILPLIIYLKIKYKIFDLFNELKVLPIFIVGWGVGKGIVFVGQKYFGFTGG